MGHLYNRINPVARSNVCPEIGPPAEPCFHALCVYGAVGGAQPDIRSRRRQRRSARGRATYRERTVRYGETDGDASGKKALFVLGEMDGGWSCSASLGLRRRRPRPIVHDLHPFFGDEIVRRGAAPAGLTWHSAPAGAGSRIRNGLPWHRGRAFHALVWGRVDRTTWAFTHWPKSRTHKRLLCSSRRRHHEAPVAAGLSVA